MKNLKEKIVDVLLNYKKSENISEDYIDDIASDILIEINNENISDNFEKAVEPAIRYLLKNHHPHTKIIIDYSNAELVEGKQSHKLNNEIPD